MMNSELSFLIDILLHHKLGKETKDVLARRINDVTEFLNARGPYAAHASRPAIVPGTLQAASTQAILDRNPDLVIPVPVEAVAQTPAAMAAMNSRSAAIANAGKVDKDTGRPNKFRGAL